MTKIECLIEDLKCYQNKTLVLCVSCGVDSMVMLDIFQKINANIIVAHVNHHRRKESDIEQAFIEKYCKDNNIKLEIKELNFSSDANFQSMARKMRYEFFDECINKYQAEFLVTAHHATDDLETIIMRLIKGSSFKGYAGIEKEVDSKNYKIIHPLLDLTKQEIITYAKECNIQYFNDASNEENHYLRNRIRHNIIPFMEQENPSLYKEIKEFKYHITEMNKMLFKEINRFEAAGIIHDTYISYDLKQFLEYSDYLQEQILFDILKPISPAKNLICELLKQIKNEKSLIINNLCDDFYMIKEYNTLSFGTIAKYDGFILQITSEGHFKLPNGASLLVDKNNCHFKDKNHEVCYNIDSLPITIRPRIEGDRIKLKNMTMSLSDYYTNKKVSHFLRNRLVITDHNNIVIHILD